MADSKKIYPRTRDKQTIYLKNVITNPAIHVGDYTMYNDFVNDPVGFDKNDVLELKWWDWPEDQIARNIHAIQTGNLRQLR